DHFNLSEWKRHFDQFLDEADVLDHVLWNPKDVKRLVQEHRNHVAQLAGELAESPPKPTLLMVRDLAANARRRFERGSPEEAVAVCYRAIEAIAQARLYETYGIRTDQVPWDRLPAKLQSRHPRPVDGKVVKLGLQDSYAWLVANGDALGRRFQELSLADRKKSPLVARNQSILAHGFQATGEEIFEKLFQALLDLGGLGREDLDKLRFPRLEV
ncbi:MAG: TIGR02710 family CRISPR-associated CARF protein, partial [Planctomycetota bacterium]